MRVLSLALALGLVAPGRAAARARATPTPDPLEPPSDRQSRRRAARPLADQLGTPRGVPNLPTSKLAEGRTGILEVPSRRSPGGRHLVEVDAGAVYLDGVRVHPSSGSVHILNAPVWRSDGNAVAWMERRMGETRLVVLPEIQPRSDVMVWPLPKALANDLVHWAADNKVVVGPELLSPRAVASWTD